MNLLDVLFVLANLIMCVGTLLLIKAVWKNRNMLKGYDKIGALLIFIPLLMFVVCYAIMHNWLAIVFASITVFYWGLVVFYTLFKKKN